jgi:hypothetical protein
MNLPLETPINRAAGRGGLVFLRVRMQGRKEVNLAVDTGSPRTLFDQSLEPSLGRRLGTTTISIPAARTGGNVYRAPRMQLGNVPLLTGRWVAVMDLSKVGYPGGLQGILGMDCLSHYCIQLDFESGKCRFLDPARINVEGRGKPLRLVRLRGGCFAVDENLAGVKGAVSGIDTGCNFDGLLTPQLFQEWTDHSHSGNLSAYVHAPNARFVGATYTNLDLHVYTCNVLGLSFLARHVVTLDFPNRMMYLKQISVGPLPQLWPAAVPAVR